MTRRDRFALLMEELVKERPDKVRVRELAGQLGFDPKIDRVRLMALVLEGAQKARRIPSRKETESSL